MAQNAGVRMLPTPQGILDANFDSVAVMDNITIKLQENILYDRQGNCDKCVSHFLISAFLCALIYCTNQISVIQDVLMHRSVVQGSNDS